MRYMPEMPGLWFGVRRWVEVLVSQSAMIVNLSLQPEHVTWSRMGVVSERLPLPQRERRFHARRWTVRLRRGRGRGAGVMGGRSTRRWRRGRGGPAGRSRRRTGPTWRWRSAWRRSPWGFGAGDAGAPRDAGDHDSVFINAGPVIEADPVIDVRLMVGFESQRVSDKSGQRESVEVFEAEFTSLAARALNDHRWPCARMA
jgi:hypothetical protein